MYEYDGDIGYDDSLEVWHRENEEFRKPSKALEFLIELSLPGGV